METKTEKKPRKAYRWGLCDKLRTIEPMTVAAVGKGTKRDAEAFCWAASRLGKEFGVKFSIRWYKGVIYATRFE